MSTRRLSIVLVAALLASAPASAPAQSSISIESLTRVRHPASATWAPGGQRVAFVRDVGGVENVLVARVGGDGPRALSDFTSPEVGGRWIEGGPIGSVFWGPDGGDVYFVRAGVLWKSAADGTGEAERVWPHMGPAGSYALSPDGDRVAFVRSGDIFVRQLDGGTERRLTDTPTSAGGLRWSPDGRRIAFIARSPSQQLMSTPSWMGEKLHFSRLRRGSSRIGVVGVQDGALWYPAGGRGDESHPRWVDGGRVAFQRVTPDLEERVILVASLSDRSVRVLDRDRNGKWWSMGYTDAGPAPSPDGTRIAFLSDRDGWSQLYVMSAGGGEPRRITSGDFEVRGLAWSPDGSRIAVSTNRGENPGARRLEIVSVGGEEARSELRPVTPSGGTATAPRWSPDGSRLLYRRTTPQHPTELYVTAPGSGEGSSLTESLPPSLRDVDFVEPRFVQFEAPDGEQVPAYLFTPPGMDDSEAHPAIVWIHGDGVNQNYDGWHVERQYSVYYSMHQRLLQQGYVVLAVDYRGSIGYGTEWREGLYRDLGGADYRDVAAGARYLGRQEYVDADRIGVWGLSYGGFLTLQGLTVTPELFACGIDVAGVTDWRMWYRDPGGSWIRGRMGRPAENPQLYTRTSPIHRVDRIQRPLTVLHGTADNNVPFLESLKLLDEMGRLGLSVDFEVYPGEYHYFHRAHVLRAAWEKVDRTFASCLSPPRR